MTLREVVTRHLDTPCLILAPTSVGDGMGGRTVTHTITSTSVCQIEAITSSERVPDDISEQAGGRQVYRYLLPYDAEIADDARIVAEGRTFDVLSVQQPPQAVVTRGMCAEV